MAPESAGLEAYRPLLFSIAYRMLGEVGDAEDVVQEAFLRAYRAMREGNVRAVSATSAASGGTPAARAAYRSLRPGS